MKIVQNTNLWYSYSTVSGIAGLSAYICGQAEKRDNKAHYSESVDTHSVLPAKGTAHALVVTATM